MKDYFGKSLETLKDKKLYLFDMDGTIYRENELFDGVIELLNYIKNKGANFAFITNNPTKSIKAYIKKLSKMGISGLTEEHFFTSLQAAILILKQHYSDKLIHFLGTRSSKTEIIKNGLRITDKYESDIGVVLASFDTELSGRKIRNICEVLTKLDVPYYATNKDLVCPVSFGAIPDCGSMCIGIEYATGKKPIYIGKPEPLMINELIKKYGVTNSQTLVIGDRLYTDIASGINAKVDTVCVLSGEATLDDIKTSEFQPTFVLDSIKDLII